jgi:methyltransferase (TIGR00027 family)
MWVAALRGLADLDDPVIVRDPLAAELLPLGYASIVRAAERAPRVTRAVLRGAARASGNLSRHMALRTRAIDDVVVSEALAGSRQLVLLGAGFDARAWRLDALSDVTVFEVDHPSTQATKREAIGSQRPLAREVNWAAIDFSRESIREVLARAGHDARVRTTFVWEGVTMYLAREAIDATLADLSELSAPSSCLVATYHDAAFRMETLPLSIIVRAAGEPFKTRMTPVEVRSRLGAHDFVVERDEGSDDWCRRYLHERGYRNAERIVTARKRS